MTTQIKSSPYAGDKLRAKLAEMLDIYDDELAPPSIDPNEAKTHYFEEPTYDNNRINFDNIPNDTEVLVWPPVSSDSEGCAWDEVPKEKLPISIHTLYLNHDGLIFGSRDNFEDKTACRQILSYLTNLKEIHVCGYYGMDYSDLKDEYPHITFINIF